MMLRTYGVTHLYGDIQQTVVASSPGDKVQVDIIVWRLLGADRQQALVKRAEKLGVIVEFA